MQLKNVIIIILSVFTILSMVNKSKTTSGNEMLMIPIVKLSTAIDYNNVSKGMLIENQEDGELYRYNGTMWDKLSTDQPQHKNLIPNAGTVLIDDILQLQGRVITPSNPVNGMIYYNSMFERLYIYADGTWENISFESDF